MGREATDENSFGKAVPVKGTVVLKTFKVA